MIWLALAAFLCALGPAALFLRNLRALRPPAPGERLASVLSPARDEERNIAAALAWSLGSGAAEIIVLDDSSSDRTADLVRQKAAEAPALIVPATLVLLLGQVAPFLLLFSGSEAVFAVALATTLLVPVVRLIARRRFRQPLSSVLLHPLGIVALLGVQWFGLVRHLGGRPAQWKGRSLGEEN